MTELAAPTCVADRVRRPDVPGRAGVRPLDRLAPVVFAHARLAMLTVTADGVVVEVNAAAARLFRRPPYELVQEPIDRHVVPGSGRHLAGCLRAAAGSTEPQSVGTCAVRRRGAEPAEVELVVSSGCWASGRELLLLQLVPPGSLS